MQTVQSDSLADGRLHGVGILLDSPTVAVVISASGRADLLFDSIKSALAQTRPVNEIVVVADPTDDLAAAVGAEFPDVRLIGHDDRRASAIRNWGLQNCETTHIVFLDAGDRLMQNAIEAGLNRFADRPDCALVYGGYRLVSESDEVEYHVLSGNDDDSNLALLRGHEVCTTAAILFRRECLLGIGGFDVTLRRCEDFDAYLRCALKYPVSAHQTITAERRIQSSSEYGVEQLEARLEILDRLGARVSTDTAFGAALREARKNHRAVYVSRLVDTAAARWRRHHNLGMLLGDLLQATRCSPRLTMRKLLDILDRKASRFLPRPVLRCMEWILCMPKSIPLGSVRFGDLRRLSPIGRHHFSRGTPIDRYYIEAFLVRHADDIRGRTLEIAGNDYTLRFGGKRVTQSDILHAVSGNSAATLVGDLATGQGIPEAAFDCVILTQTLLFVYEIKDAVLQIWNALRPGGVALITVPGISQISRYDMGRWGEYWHLTDLSARQLFGDVFGRENVQVVTYGNVLAACAFLHCIGAEELRKDELDHRDADYQVTIGIRVTRPMESPNQ
jgi:glycosyltransferase involved in cell wall biosynthesis